MTLQFKRHLLGLAGGCTFAVVVYAGSPAFPNETGYKQQATELLKSIETGESKPLTYINPTKYIQHNLAVGGVAAGAIVGGALAAPRARHRQQTPVYAFQARDGELAAWSVEIRERAVLRLGELNAEGPKAKGGRHKKIIGIKKTPIKKVKSLSDLAPAARREAEED